MKNIEYKLLSIIRCWYCYNYRLIIYCINVELSNYCRTFLLYWYLRNGHIFYYSTSWKILVQRRKSSLWLF